jgi:hypothetical protein
MACCGVLLRAAAGRGGLRRAAAGCGAAARTARLNMLPRLLAQPMLARLSVTELLQAAHGVEALVLERDRQGCDSARRLGHHVEALL